MAFTIAFLCYTGLVIVWAMCSTHYIHNQAVNRLVGAFLVDFKTIPNFFIALLIFYFFQNVHIGVNRTINFFASGSFSVYIVHQTPAFIPVLWNDIYRANHWIHSDYALLYALGTILSCYLVINFLDYFRRKYIEPVILSSRIFEYICKKFESL